MAQESWRHHFAPQAYLAGWAQPSAPKLVFASARNNRGVVHESLCSTKTVGFLRHLYTAAPRPLAPRWATGPKCSWEEAFFSKHDDRAAFVLRKLRAPDASPSSLTDTERRNFALFLNGLMEREPEILADNEAKALAAVLETVREWSERPDPHGIISSCLPLLDPEFEARVGSRIAMHRQIADEEVIRWICSWRWLLVDTDLPLITGDRPLLVTEKAGSNGDRLISLLRIAISPSRMLVIHPPNLELHSEVIAQLLVAYIVEVVSRAWRTVVADRPLTDVGPIRYKRIVEHLLGPPEWRTTSIRPFGLG